MRSPRNWARVVGLLVLAVILWRLDLRQLASVIQEVALVPLLIALVLIVPLIYLKVVRWRYLLGAHRIQYGLRSALLAYFGGLFVGLLTPGRLGEFVRALHVSQDCEVPVARASATVLADRLFDLMVLLLVGAIALSTLTTSAEASSPFIILGSVMVVAVPLALFIYGPAFRRLQALGPRLGSLGRGALQSGGWLVQLRSGLRDLTWPTLVRGTALTILTYVIFFGQCYLIALALDLRVGLLQVCYVISLGSLVTLVPISVAGLGTREATMIAYLGSLGISAEAAMGFSLLVFLVFYVGVGLIGAAAWWAKPVTLARGSRSSVTNLT